MDDSETMDLVVVRFFEDHNIDDGLPALEGICVVNGQIKKPDLVIDEVLALSIKLLSFWGLVVELMK